MSLTIEAIIQSRRDTAINWSSADPVLLDGEIGIEVDTMKLKVGDGSTAWSSLPYFIGGDAHYIHTQVASSASWIVTHSLGKIPSTVVTDGAGRVVIADISHNSVNQLVITFGSSQSGIAYLN